MFGNDFSRENLLKQATTLKDFIPPLVLQGVRVFNSPKDYNAFHDMQLAQFDGTQWNGLGDVIALD